MMKKVVKKLAFLETVLCLGTSVNKIAFLHWFHINQHYLLLTCTLRCGDTFSYIHIFLTTSELLWHFQQVWMQDWETSRVYPNPTKPQLKSLSFIRSPNPIACLKTFILQKLTKVSQKASWNWVKNGSR